MSANEKAEVLFILGGPGAGKGTLCWHLVEKFGYVHLSAGDLLREERGNPNSEYGELIESYIKDGKIVPVAITCSLLDKAIQSSTVSPKRFLIDGFPRNQDNVAGWNETMPDKCTVKGVLFCECSKEVCTQRCLKRGAAGSGRIDDNEEVLAKRHETYIKHTLPIIEHFQKQNLLFTVNTMQTPEKVCLDTAEILKQIGWIRDS